MQLGRNLSAQPVNVVPAENLYPGWSGSMFVPVRDAAEAVMAMDAQLGELAEIAFDSSSRRQVRTQRSMIAFVQGFVRRCARP
jgi:hypothetical protein